MYNQKLKKVRQLLSLSAYYVANGMKVTRQTINNIERGYCLTDATCNYYRLWLISYMEEHFKELTKVDEVIDYQQIIEDLKKIKP